MTLASCIYEGRVRHRRFVPRRHEFQQRVFLLYLDLDELPRLFQHRWLWSADRPNLAWFRRADHLGPADKPLAESVRDLVEERHGVRPAGPIRLLTQLRHAGFAMNPISLYYCFSESEDLEFVVAEVNNTPWNEQHCYVLDLRGGTERSLRASVSKDFHVSPFLREDHQYDWTFTTPGERLLTQCQSLEQGRLIFQSTSKLERRPWAASALHGQLLRFPWVTAKVITAIHWQALRLLWKKVPIVHHPGSGRYQKRNVQNLGGSWSAGS